MAAKILLQSAPARPQPGMRPYCIVLRDLGDTEGGHRYVTHRRGLDAIGGYMTGCYFRDIDEARESFFERCRQDDCAVSEEV